MALPFPLAESAPESSQPFALGTASRDPRALRILAKSIYRELRGGGLAEEDVMSIAGELLSLVAGEVKDRRRTQDG
jgi:xanthine/CO dehydrogenase XdhC/CoxF family maturation factor